MIPLRRLKLVLGRALGNHTQQNPGKLPEMPHSAHESALQRYVRGPDADKKLADFIESVSSLRIATREDWVRIKQISFVYLDVLSCRTANKLLSLLVESGTCGLVECVKIQEQLSKPLFVSDLTIQEQSETLRCIAKVGARLSQKFLPYALEAFKRIIRDSQVKMLPMLTYTLGCICASSENRDLTTEKSCEILEELLRRIEVENHALLTQDELIYLFWGISTFCSWMAPIRKFYLSLCEKLLMQSIQNCGYEGSSPRELALLIFGLCPLIFLSGLRSCTLNNQDNGFIVNVLSASEFEPREISKDLFSKTITMFDTAIREVIQKFVNGQLQSKRIIRQLVDIIVWCGVSRINKNAQIFVHLAMRKLMYKDLDYWLHAHNNCETHGIEMTKSVMNMYAFSREIETIDRLACRLKTTIPSEASLWGLEKLSIQETVTILNALADGNLSEQTKKMYQKDCLKKVPRAIQCASVDDFLCITTAIRKMDIKDETILKSIGSRGLEFDLMYQWPVPSKSEKARESRKDLEISPKMECCSDEMALWICEQVTEMHPKNETSMKDILNVLEAYDKRTGLLSATNKQCVAIIGSFSKSLIRYKYNNEQSDALTSIFRRAKITTSIRLALLLVCQGSKAGVPRSTLLDTLSWIGSFLLESKKVTCEDVVVYIVIAHEIGALKTLYHPKIFSIFYGNKLDEVDLHLLGRLFGALCDHGIAEGSLLEKIIKALKPWTTEMALKTKWSEAELRVAITMVNSLWTFSARSIGKCLLRHAVALVSAMARMDSMPSKETALCIAGSIATVIVHSVEEEGISENTSPPMDSEVLSFFFDMVTRLFSENGLTFSLTRAQELIGSKSDPFIPKWDGTVCSIVVSNAIQYLTQQKSDWRKLTQLGVNLWRYCLKQVEKGVITDEMLPIRLSFCIRFGASSQAFDRFMTLLMESDNSVDMLAVCSIAEGLHRTGKRRSIATQFIAHYAQQNCLDELPAPALCSLLLFFTRDAEKVALGLKRVTMLVALIWSSLSLKMDQLQYTVEHWKLVESVPAAVAPSLLETVCKSDLIERTPAGELVRPVSIIVGWSSCMTDTSILTNFLKKVTSLLQHTVDNGKALDATSKDLLQVVSSALQSL
ncbi:hypothetical protein TRVL_04191 [Trypanosoma vivax]|nr:hypothetical protein TRVL_04191 [Trypanosoma vivax]